MDTEKMVGAPQRRELVWVDLVGEVREASLSEVWVRALLPWETCEHSVRESPATSCARANELSNPGFFYFFHR